MQANTLQHLPHQDNRLSQLLTFAEVCNLLRKSRSGVYKLMAADSTFPRPMKDGDSRQARSYFSADELAVWQKSKLEARDVA